MCKTIKHKVRFKASPETIYDLLADSRKRTEVIPGGGTELELTHRGVPKPLLDDTEEYWRHVYWAPMRARR